MSEHLMVAILLVWLGGTVALIGEWLIEADAIDIEPENVAPVIVLGTLLWPLMMLAILASKAWRR